MLPKRIADNIIPEPNSGCWLWAGALLHGYGVTYLNGKNRKAHRVVFEDERGPIPDGAILCHHCDVRCCVNPDHVYVGTHLSNMQDKLKRGRTNLPSGKDHHFCRLSESEVIGVFHASGTNTSIAREYGISDMHVHRIKSGQRWKHLNLSNQKEIPCSSV